MVRLKSNHLEDRARIKSPSRQFSQSQIYQQAVQLESGHPVNISAKVKSPSKQFSQSQVTYSRQFSQGQVNQQTDQLESGGQQMVQSCQDELEINCPLEYLQVQVTTLASLFFITMIPTDCKIIYFPNACNNTYSYTYFDVFV